ncbi:MAG: TrkH family potassium uptake protein [Thermodesulfobacteriota bacterium]
MAAYPHPSFWLRLGRRINPPQALVLSFALLIVLGALLLCLPGLTPHQGVGFINALFTATSAVCVTGLVVVDTGSAFTLPGQIVILLLIQLGGLGIMTLSVFFYRLVGLEVSIRQELTVKSTFSYLPHRDVPGLVKSVVAVTLIIEAAGAAALTLLWLPDHGPGRALYLAVFHSVSAFCNAGFSLWPDSLTRYAADLGVNLVFLALITAGGLGFIVLMDLFRLTGPGRRRLSLHSKIVCSTSALLVLAGTAVFLGMEWSNVLAGLGWLDKLVVSVFQAVTPRTAGFNTADYARLADTTLLFTIFLMFVGGSPGSTAGGIKTVTLALLFALAVSRARGFSRVNLFKRTVRDEIVHRSLFITLMAIALIGLALMMLLAVETGHLDHPASQGAFLGLAFETVSAFGTVGLSMGATAGLTVPGKLIIIAVMFLGRVGPLTAAMALMRRSQMERSYNYGAEEVMVG